MSNAATAEPHKILRDAADVAHATWRAIAAETGLAERACRAASGPGSDRVKLRALDQEAMRLEALEDAAHAKYLAANEAAEDALRAFYGRLSA